MEFPEQYLTVLLALDPDHELGDEMGDFCDDRRSKLGFPDSFLKILFDAVPLGRY